MLTFKFPDLESFYIECDKVECEHNQSDINDLLDDNACIIKWGLSVEEIMKSKYTYSKGLDQLEELNLDWSLGGSAKKTKWSEIDGDEMSIERLNDTLPFMQQRIRKSGDANGKFIDLYINMDACASIGSKALMFRAYTVVQICDWLETNGYKVSITVYDSYNTPGGKYKGNSVGGKVLIEIILKGYEDSLNRGMLLAASAPWMLRVHLFRFMYAKISSGSWGCGRIVKGDGSKNTIDMGFDIYDKESAKRYIETIKEQFESDNSSKYID